MNKKMEKALQYAAQFYEDISFSEEDKGVYYVGEDGEKNMYNI